ncbi:hypothetical protein [Myxosarcina sp. GI1]|uniref:hypothetical protein n=1 Tax=Myxosarcina sp. GI1 TaxID=1541065 RepID=UPI00055C5912|nr:hypothetical protein [Myxosarcina sp. GI1]
MYLLPPQPTNSEICISGDVEIHPSASVAPGVILQAAPQSKIIIGADVCLGMGVILSVDRGKIEIERGAALGSGVLVIGASKIGNNACVGTATTIFKTSVAAMAVIPPGSLIGDTSRQSESSEANNTTQQSSGGRDDDAKKARQPKTKPKGFEASQTESESNTSQPEASKGTDTVVGKVYIDRLMMTLFPHKKSLNSNSQNEGSNGRHP